MAKHINKDKPGCWKLKDLLKEKQDRVDKHKKQEKKRLQKQRKGRK